MEAYNSSSEKIKSVAILITLLAISFALGYWFHTCNHIPVKQSNDIAYKAKIDSLSNCVKAKQDAIAKIKTEFNKLDSINKIIKPVYRKTKTDSRDFISKHLCDSIGILQAYDNVVQKCDTVIIVDSLQINKLQKENENLLDITKDHYLMLVENNKQLLAKDIDLGIEKKKVKIEKRKKIVAIGAGILAVLATIFIIK